MNSLLLINIAYIGSWKHFVSVFVCVCVSLSLYLSFCNSSSQSLSSPDDELSENIWFVWFKTSYDGDKWRCYHGDKWTTNNKVKIELVNKLTKDCWLSQFYRIKTFAQFLDEFFRFWRSFSFLRHSWRSLSRRARLLKTKMISRNDLTFPPKKKE